MKSVNLRLPAEWEEQSAILIAWPHEHTDWNYMLDEVESCYASIAEAITKDEDLIIVTPDTKSVSKKLLHIGNLFFFLNLYNKH